MDPYLHYLGFWLICYMLALPILTIMSSSRPSDISSLQILLEGAIMRSVTATVMTGSYWLFTNYPA